MPLLAGLNPSQTPKFTTCCILPTLPTCMIQTFGEMSIHCRGSGGFNTHFIRGWQADKKIQLIQTGDTYHPKVMCQRRLCRQAFYICLSSLLHVAAGAGPTNLSVIAYPSPFTMMSRQTGIA